MLDHIGVAVSDVAKSKSFFEAALAPIGYKVLMDFGEAVGLGQDRPDFWIAKGPVAAASHIAFAAPNRAAVKSILQRCYLSRWQGQWRAGTSSPVSSHLLWRLCLRSRRQQRRGSVPSA